ncbi:MAG: hypothetical protein ACT4QE_00485 [Anaerolineales bacterium]
MDWLTAIDNRVWYTLLALIALALVLAVLLGAWVMWRVRRINLPPDADTLTALRATPLSVVLLLDLLDFSLDFLSAPLAWIILGRLGLAPLRGVTTVEALIPGTQFIPTMTLAWIFARLTATRQRVLE